MSTLNPIGSPAVSVVHNITLATVKTEQHWVSDFTDCCFYKEKDEDGEEHRMCFPYFIPMALCGTCCLLGRVQTLQRREKKLCCEMGPSGWGCCILSTPINLFGPLGGCCWFAINSARIREDTVERYNIVEESSCPSCVVGVCYPMSLFQVLMKLRALEQSSDLL